MSFKLCSGQVLSTRSLNLWPKLRQMNDGNSSPWPFDDKQNVIVARGHKQMHIQTNKNQKHASGEKKAANTAQLPTTLHGAALTADTTKRISLSLSPLSALENTQKNLQGSRGVISTLNSIQKRKGTYTRMHARPCSQRVVEVTGEMPCTSMVGGSPEVSSSSWLR